MNDRPPSTARRTLQSLYARWFWALSSLVAVVQGVVLLPILWVSLTAAGDASRASIAATIARRSEQQGMALVNLVAEQLINPLYVYDLDTIQAVLHATREQPLVRLLYLANTHGEPLADDLLGAMHESVEPNPSLVQTAIAGAEVASELSGRELRVARPLRIGSQVLGILRISIDLSAQDADLAALDRTLDDVTRRSMSISAVFAIAISAALSVFGLGVGMILARQLARPITALAAYAEEIGRAGDAARPSVPTTVTEIEQLSRALSQMAGALRDRQDEMVRSEKLAALAQLVAGIAHEVNTPVGVALTGASALKDAADAFAERLKAGAIKRTELDGFVQTMRNAATLVVDSSERAGTLVRTFKQVAVHEVGGEIRRVDLVSFLTNLAASLRVQFRGSQITVDTALPDILEVETDAEALAQLIQQLASNAEDHAFADGTPGRILIALNGLPDGGAVLTVADDGAGMPVEVRHRIWDPFFTTRRGRGNNTGLGLHIVHNLVHGRLGATISCDSELGKGTAFVVRLPVRAPQQAATDAASHAPPSGAAPT